MSEGSKKKSFHIRRETLVGKLLLKCVEWILVLVCPPVERTRAHTHTLGSLASTQVIELLHIFVHFI